MTEPHRINFNDFVESISHFNRISFFDNLLNNVWAIWQNPIQNPGAPENQNKFLLRAYCGRISSIAAAVTSQLGPDIASIDRIYQSIHQYLDVEDTIESTQEFTKSDSQPLVEGLRGSKVLANLDNDPIKLGQIALHLFLSRHFRSQNEFNLIGNQSLYRILLIFKELSKINGRHLEQIEKQINCNPVDVIRSVYGFLGLGNQAKGRINLSNLTITDDAKTVLDVNLELLRLIAKRWSGNKEVFKIWLEKVNILPSVFRKYAPYQLADTPLIHVDESFQLGAKKIDGSYHFLCPSPWNLFRKAENYLIEAIHAIDEKDRSQNILSDFGAATESYLQNSLTHIVKDKNLIKPSTDKSQVADFLIKSQNGETVIIIELKKTFGHHKELNLALPKNIVDIFEKLYGACEQCATTKEKLEKYLSPKDFKLVKNHISIICTLEPIVTEGDIFVHYALVSGLLKKLGLKNLEILSIDQLESALVTDGPDKMSKEILELWKTMTLQKLQNNGSYLAHLEKNGNIYEKYKQWDFFDGVSKEIFTKK